MKRSNRLVLLIGVFLALIAFVLILFSLQKPSTTETTSKNQTTMVVAALDVPLGETFQDADVREDTVDITVFPANGIKLKSLVIGQIARQPVTAGQAITNDVLTGGGGGIKAITVPPGYVAMSIQVDQSTGVGTIIKSGDYVDIVTSVTGADKVPTVVAFTPRPGATQRANATPAPAGLGTETRPYNSTTVKTLVQGVQVLGTLLPPPTNQGANNATPQPGGATTTLNGQQQIVIVAVSTQDAEIIKFGQIDGSISLVLRSSQDCQVAEASPTPLPSESTLLPTPSPSPSPSGSPGATVTNCPVVATTGITLRRLVDDRGILPPPVMEVIVPTPYPAPSFVAP